MSNRSPGVLVSAEAYLKSRGPLGGVQICTREYQATIQAAGYDLEIVAYQPDRRPLTRIRRVLARRPYIGMLPPDLADRIVGAAKDANAVFLNQVDLTPLAAELRRRLRPDCRIVLLSHGLESVDYLHAIRARVAGQPFAGLTRREEWLLGRLLVQECQFRLHVDQVFCLAPFELEIEKWLGSRRVEWLPRTVSLDPVDWRPIVGRIGFVGTLNHPPNREGLELFLEALAALLGRGAESAIRVRLVGGPANVARNLTSKYPWVEYLGSLPDADLRSEAATWACFVHPLFCYARGCSTKLAVGLGWGIPVITTPQGHRGYEWGTGELAVANSPGELATLASQSTDLAACAAMRQQILTLAASTPTLADVVDRFRAALDVDACRATFTKQQLVT